MHIHRVLIKRVSPPRPAAAAAGAAAPLNFSAPQWAALLASASTYADARTLKAGADPARAGSPPSHPDLSRGPWVGRARLLAPDAPAGGIAPAPAALDVVLKVRPARSSAATLRLLLGLGQFVRHWRAAAILAAKRLPTAMPLCLALVWIDGHVCEVLAMRALDGPTLLDAAAEAAQAAPGRSNIREQHALAGAAGRLVAQLSAVALFNRDHKPSNIIVARPPEGGAPALALVDCVGVRRSGQPLHQPHLVRMFERQLVEPLGCGVGVRKALAMRALRAAWLFIADHHQAGGRSGQPQRAEWRAWRNQTWGDVARLLSTTADPRPLHNPVQSRGQSGPPQRR